MSSFSHHHHLGCSRLSKCLLCRNWRKHKMFRCKQQPDKNMHCILLLIESMKLHNAMRMCTGIQSVFFDIFAPFSTSRLNGKNPFSLSIWCFLIYLVVVLFIFLFSFFCCCCCWIVDIDVVVVIVVGRAWSSSYLKCFRCYDCGECVYISRINDNIVDRIEGVDWCEHTHSIWLVLQSIRTFVINNRKIPLIMI